MIRALLAAFLVATAAACGGVAQRPPTATPTGSTSPTLAARTSPPPSPAGSPVATYLSAPLADVRTGETFRLGDFRGRVTLVQAMAVW